MVFLYIAIPEIISRFPYWLVIFSVSGNCTVSVLVHTSHVHVKNACTGQISRTAAFRHEACLVWILTVTAKLPFWKVLACMRLPKVRSPDVSVSIISSLYFWTVILLSLWTRWVWFVFLRLQTGSSREVMHFETRVSFRSPGLPSWLGPLLAGDLMPHTSSLRHRFLPQLRDGSGVVCGPARL